MLTQWGDLIMTSHSGPHIFFSGPHKLSLLIPIVSSFRDLEVDTSCSWKQSGEAVDHLFHFHLACDLPFGGLHGLLSMCRAAGEGLGQTQCWLSRGKEKSDEAV